jgi:phosphopantothenoylcysteine decarboxylase/phosphopantothenate--cysteine ligase
VVSAGGTREPLDPVRYLGNRSSGEQGFALARVAARRGAEVVLVAANTSLTAPEGVKVVPVQTALELQDAVSSAAASVDVVVMAAAVADFRPATPAGTKLPREDAMTLHLETTPDILAELARIARGADSDGVVTREPLSPRPILVGFAAETGSLERAGEKLRRKGVDLLVANDVAEPGSGFGTETNRVSILAADGSRDDLPLQSKRAVADALLDRVAAALDARDASAHTGTTPEPEREPA